MEKGRVSSCFPKKMTTGQAAIAVKERVTPPKKGEGVNIDAGANQFWSVTLQRRHWGN